MSARRGSLVASTARRALRRGLLGLAAAPVSIAACLVVADAVRKHRHQDRSSFRNPGTATLDVADSTLTVYTFGEDLYRDMLAAIRGARQSILFETYIWKSDQVGQEFKDALDDAAERGVDVYVIYDRIGNLVVHPDFYTFHADVNVLRFPVLRPHIQAGNIPSGGLDHRKVMVVDGEIGFVGGYNIGNLYATEWRDTHLRIVGPNVWELRRTFADFWNRHRHPTDAPSIPPTGPGLWEPRIRAVNNVPASLSFPIRALYLNAINRASERIFITMGYFIPDRQILEGLEEASRRGVDVRVLLPERSNHVVADWLAHGFFAEMLDAGITVLLYETAMVHAKTATIDGQWTTIGSANIDRLSFTGNYEVNVEIFNPDLARAMERIFAIDSESCRVLTAEEWEERPVAARLSESILVPLRPLM